jgi:hypothetical protein
MTAKSARRVIAQGTPKYIYIDFAKIGNPEAKSERMKVIPATAEFALMP